MAVNRVEGLDTILRNMNREIAGIEGRGMDGLWEAGLLIQRRSQQILRDSVVTGNLRASGYTRRAGSFVRLDDSQLDPENSQPIPSDRLINEVEIGFTANYAVFAHENVEGNRAPKFLENPVRNNQKRIIDVVRKRAKI